MNTKNKTEHNKIIQLIQLKKCLKIAQIFLLSQREENSETAKKEYCS